jgi:hypothetical protein
MQIGLAVAAVAAAVAVGFGGCSGRDGSEGKGRLFEGYYETGFEISAFYPGKACPADGEQYWLVAAEGSGFSERLGELMKDPPASGPPISGLYRVKFLGAVSDVGQYGHLGAYTREVTVNKLQEMERGRCPRG